jgi:hypothetical protein
MDGYLRSAVSTRNRRHGSRPSRARRAEAPRSRRVERRISLPRRAKILEKAPETFGGGFSMHVAAWPLLARHWPGDRVPDRPVRHLDVRAARRRKRRREDLLRHRRRARLVARHAVRDQTPKFIMGGVALEFCMWANGPGAGKGRDWNSRRQVRRRPAQSVGAVATGRAEPAARHLRRAVRLRLPAAAADRTRRRPRPARCRPATSAGRCSSTPRTSRGRSRSSRRSSSKPHDRQARARRAVPRQPPGRSEPRAADGDAVRAGVRRRSMRTACSTRAWRRRASRRRRGHARLVHNIRRIEGGAVGRVAAWFAGGEPRWAASTPAQRRAHDDRPGLVDVAHPHAQDGRRTRASPSTGSSSRRRSRSTATRSATAGTQATCAIGSDGAGRRCPSTSSLPTPAAARALARAAESRPPAGRGPGRRRVHAADARRSRSRT